MFKSNNNQRKSESSNTNMADNQSEKVRTIYVENVPTTVKKTQLLKLFSKYGRIECIRLRCKAPMEPNVTKSAVLIKKMLHRSSLTLHCYIR